MNIFQELKAAWSAKSTAEALIMEAKMETASGKPGWKTSEFWMDAATKVGILWGTVQGFIPPKWAAIITAAGTAVYVIARTVSKAVADIQSAAAVAPVAETANANVTINK